MPSIYRVVGWGYAGLCATLVIVSRVDRAPRAEPRVRGPVARTMPAPTPAPVERTPTPSEAPEPAPTPTGTEPNAAEWFRRVKPYCNSVEVTTLQRGSPPPATVEGTGYHAACLALAGKIDDARHAIDELSAEGRMRAAGIVFEIGHPVADAGDDRSAGPIMELVVDYIPNHYMALYHAGMAEYMLGQRDLAKRNLTEFLRFYQENDGWTSNAKQVLERIGDPGNVAADPRRPREP